MKTNDRHPNEDATAYLSGELPEEARRQFAARLADDPDLREEVAILESIRARLLAAPEAAPSPDLPDRVMAAIRTEKEQETRHEKFRLARWPSVVALAACLALGLMVLGQLFTPKKSTVPGGPSVAAADIHRDKALGWLVANQAPDGSWDVARWGGNPKFKVALTALSTLALLESASTSGPALGAATRACDWLATQQSPDGTFGPAFQGTPYNQAMATMALLQLQRLAPDQVKKELLDRAVAAITRRQLPDGGWGYQSPFLRGDHSITEWNLAALEQAAGLGWDGLETRAERARAWMRGRPRSHDPAGPASLSESLARATSQRGGPDLYAAYFKVRELVHSPDAASLGQLAALRKSLKASQESTGDLAGSWPPEDRWSIAGGRLYSTAMATLALASR